ncbi:MAG: hypothetical protein A3G60_01635 [Candidatus Ryanbacteria bacterium RIFCSPLOWO2_12_FULL_47_9c]|uniref:Uncharacterized protein n=1 Tax=Candidatus Ryanbacteria bacterium RIFCSPLOWO2_12_FULL_47_9c TaxID=1802131 RepID=A0A1G2H3F8_9BACT|nr:MAG: hypothetical protein A3G60_01635 [Candidatus Ryanbacteria bacterium RIFCSPLOWO2_12_FULL_47_9c]
MLECESPYLGFEYPLDGVIGVFRPSLVRASEAVPIVEVVVSVFEQDMRNAVDGPTHGGLDGHGRNRGHVHALPCLGGDVSVHVSDFLANTNKTRELLVGNLVFHLALL